MSIRRNSPSKSRIMISQVGYLVFHGVTLQCKRKERIRERLRGGYKVWYKVWLLTPKKVKVVAVILKGKTNTSAKMNLIPILNNRNKTFWGLQEIQLNTAGGSSFQSEEENLSEDESQLLRNC
ncbi:uncharacterized protein LOC117180561 [Belonocnema kinseyi]|uniref:uncharacterized protein LOC117180561 n=1 Tax=Belonocnema kinseyi TaxID=2817044 RepID=UPI00143DBABC|nr:uncharacterized protein LOC117180561 [Belonocnema kinseyi]